MKKCPYCAEEIQDDAIKCRYCQSDFSHSVSSQVDYDYGRALSNEEKLYLADLPRKPDLSKNAMGDAQCVNKKNNDKIIVGIIFGFFILIGGIMNEITNVKNVSDASKNNVNKTQNVEAKKEDVNNKIKSSEVDSCISKYTNQGYSQTEAGYICEANENLDVEVKKKMSNIEKEIKKEDVSNTVKSSETDSCISKYANQGYSQTEAESICEAAENLMWATQ